MANDVKKRFGWCERMFARMFSLVLGLDYTIAIHWDGRSRSHFRPLKKSVSYFVLGCLGIVSLGIGGLAVEGLVWGYHNLAMAFESQVNNRLKGQLNEITQQQSRITVRMDSLRATELKLRALYGMQTGSKGPSPFGIGGRRNLGGDGSVANDLQNQLFQASLESQKLRSQLGWAMNTLSNLQEFIRYRQKIWDHTPSVAPARGTLSSGFGYRIHPVTGAYTQHAGLDIVGDTWTPIHAPATGVVSFSGWSGFYGNSVMIDHGNGYSTRFAHLSRITVEKGTIINRYDMIGYMGATGRATGTHLHYEVHRDGKPVDPERFILPSGVIVD